MKTLLAWFYRTFVYSDEQIQRAKQIAGIVQDSTSNLGCLGYNRNSQGELIRAVIKNTRPNHQHPLITRYK